MSNFNKKQLQSDPNLRVESVGDMTESQHLPQAVQTMGTNSPKVMPYDDGISPNVKSQKISFKEPSKKKI